ncbi:GNAT family N-acetyltransferase [Pseudohongiella sp.]|nr:GNAT family N-acetyltransferase [Pseudohongiella sp.]
MSKIEVRVLGPHDWQRYKYIRLASLLDSPDSFGSTYTGEAAYPDSEWQSRLDPAARAKNALPLVAETDGDAVGLAWGLIHDPDPRIAHIYQMWVSPAHQGKGVARTLLDEIRTWAISRRCERLALSVTTNNDAAVGLYLASGFTASGPLEALRPGSALTVQTMTMELRSD